MPRRKKDDSSFGPRLTAVRKARGLIRAEDDEELSEADRRAVAASREYFRQNPEGGIPFEQMVAECGFTMDQIRHHQAD